ncbi:MAG: NAD(+)/NADH kinase [Planctomycetes bacterium]|nr:NAD(+)/NADH kinase [Planctomycetota bacterium]
MKNWSRVLVLADAEKNAVQDLVRVLEPWLRARSQELSIERDVREFYKRRSEKNGGAREPKSQKPDLIVVLGGDGAILAAVRAFADEPVPTIGINFGRVGFLASVEATHWQASLNQVFEGRAVVEPRMRLVAEMVSAGRPTVRAVALNDAVLTRGAFQGMLSIALRDGADWVTNYRSDGLVVATPSGSTAYSMAAGGPILAPSMHAFVVTPVSPQALSHRPLVIDGDHELVLDVTHASGLTTLVVDGQGFYPMHEGDTVRITRHPVAYPLLSLPGFDAYKRLRERLGWRGSFEPDVFPSEAPASGTDSL